MVRAGGIAYILEVEQILFDPDRNYCVYLKGLALGGVCIIPKLKPPLPIPLVMVPKDQQVSFP